MKLYNVSIQFCPFLCLNYANMAKNCHSKIKIQGIQNQANTSLFTKKMIKE